MRSLLNFSGLLIIAFLLPGDALAGEYNFREYSKVIQESFPLRIGGKVRLDNQHGSIRINTWEREEVRIEARISTNAKNDRKGKETLDRISVDFSSSGNYVSASTELKTQKSVWWFIQDWLGEADIQIDFEVSMPKEADLEIDHQYGKVDVEELFGDAEISLRHGDLELDHVSGVLRLTLTHGNGIISKVNETDADLSFYKLRINDANEIDLEGRFSRLNLSSANKLEARSSNTKYYLDDVGLIDLENKYGTIEIEKLEEGFIRANHCDVEIDMLIYRLEADVEFGDLHLDQVDEGLEFLALEAENSGLNLDLSTLPGYALNLNSDQASLDLPEMLTKKSGLEYDDDVDFDGIVGSAGAKTRVEIIAINGGVKIQ